MSSEQSANLEFSIPNFISRHSLLVLLIFVAALLLRLYASGTFLTIDEVKWAEGAAQFLLALHSSDLPQTYWHFFPGITITWGSALTLWALCTPAPDLTVCVNAQVENLAGSIGWLRLWPVLLNSLGVTGVYVWGRKLLGHGLALLTALLLAFDPFFIAHSRILNGDAGAAILMFLSLLTFLSYWLGETANGETASSKASATPKLLHPSLIISGILAGLALLTKLPSPLIFLFVGGLGLAAIIKDFFRHPGTDRPNPKLVLSKVEVSKILLVWGGIALLVFIALWPAMWVAPLETLRLMYADTFEVGGAGQGHATFFLGQTVTGPGPWFYPYVIAFRLTPVVTVGLLASLIWLFLNLSHYLHNRYLRSHILQSKTCPELHPEGPPERLPVQPTRGRAAVEGLDKGRNQRTQNLNPKTQNTQSPISNLQSPISNTQSPIPNLQYPESGHRSPISNLQSPIPLIMLAFIIFIILFSNASPKKLDRYVMAVIPALIFLSALGFTKIIAWGPSILRNTQSAIRSTQSAIRSTQYATRNLNLALIAIVALQLLFAIFATPYYLTYYNPLLGGVNRAASQVPVGWGEGLEQAAFYLNNLQDAQSLAVSSWYSDIFQPYFVGQQASFSDDGRAQLAADYVVFYVNQIQRQKPYAGLVDYFRAKEPVFVVAVRPTGGIVNSADTGEGNHRVHWVEVYQAPAAQSASGAPEVEGVAQLLAYKLSSTELLAGAEVPITLFLRVLGPLPDDTTISLTLTDGTLWGEWTLTEIKGEWQEGHIVEWHGVLTLPTAMRPGEYRLRAVFQFENGPVITEFSISEKDPALNVEWTTP